MLRTSDLRAILAASALSGLVLSIGAMSAPPAYALPADQIGYGTGGTLSAQLIRQLTNCYGIPYPQGSAVPDPTCPAPDNVTFPYAATGSGPGLISYTNYTQNTATAQPSPPASDAGFGITYPYGTAANPSFIFVGSDAQLTCTQLQAYGYPIGCGGGPAQPAAGTYLRNGPALQFPLAGTAVAISYNPTSLVAPPGRLTLTRNQYCGIWGGYLTSWNQINPAFPAQPIIRVVRDTGSGTTDIFSQRLAKQCQTLPGDSVAFPFPFDFTPGETVNWNARGNPVVTANGNGGVAAAVAAAAFRVGYNVPNAIQPLVNINAYAALLQDAASAFSGGAPTYVDPTNIATFQSATQQVRPPCANNAVSSCIGSQDAFTDPLNWSAMQGGTAAPGVIADIDYPGFNTAPKTAGLYPIVGLTYFDTYACISRDNLTVATQGFVSFLVVNSQAVRNIYAALDFATLSSNQRRAINQLVNADIRTAVRLGPAPARRGFPGCSAGAGPI